MVDMISARVTTHLIENASCTYKFNAFPFSLRSLYTENLYQTKYRESNSTVSHDIGVCRHKEGNVGNCPAISLLQLLTVISLQDALKITIFLGFKDALDFPI